MPEEFGCVKGENGHRVDPSLLGLEEGISCACGSVIYCVGSNINIGR